MSHIQFLETYTVEAAKPNLSGITVTCEESIKLPGYGVRMKPEVGGRSPGPHHRTPGYRINGEM